MDGVPNGSIGPPGSPGIPPRWTRGAKDAIGTAYSSSSRLWFTLAQGTLTEVYYPTVDHPQVRDLQYLVTDGATFCHRERHDCDSRAEALGTHALGYRVISEDRQGRYRIYKEIIADPHLCCVLMFTRFEPLSSDGHDLRLFVLCAPHLGGGGAHNNAEVGRAAGHRVLLAYRGSNWLALGANIPLAGCTCGYVGVSDGWTDLDANHRLTHKFENALDGNVALTAELDLNSGREFTLSLSMGHTRQSAINTLLQSLSTPFAHSRDRFLEQWERTCKPKLPLQKHSHDGGRLYERSISLLLAHEDKSYPGALIASLSIPWGEVKGDEDLGGYHLVWTRDMANSATGLLAAGYDQTARRAATYLAAAQRPDGGFAQNFWIDGEPYWQGIQLDEVSLPVILAWRLHRQQRLREFDPYAMVLSAMGFLIRNGPATPQERWEEAGGYSPSTLAANIAALVCAAHFAREREDSAVAAFLLDYADFLESHIEAWTVTSSGTLVPGIPRHYIRINPAPLTSAGRDENPDGADLHVNNRPPGEPDSFPARQIVDAGFLELVRYGIRSPGDPLIEDSLRVVDAVLKVNTPFGPCWRRYNHDGYGQRADGSAYAGWGVGRPWPLLAGERAHYELAAGRPVDGYITALERLANQLGLLPEQVWDQPDIPSQFLFFGRPTGSAMPLMWAHAEYLKLLRSVADGVVFDLIPDVAARYLKPRIRSSLDVWKLNRQIRAVDPGTKLRFLMDAPFMLHFTRDGWKTVDDQHSNSSGLGVEFADVSIPRSQRAPLQFTFRWATGEWIGRDFMIEVTAPPPASSGAH